tara:strand:+ start:1314 stop:3245 length:1932 start_codon:yes stop_codon:yes gene_type:complete
MSNPPTFNDLKRARNLYNSQQRNKILLGSSIPLKIGTPSLTVPDFTFNFLSIDNNYVATGDELGANGNQLDFINARKFIDYPLLEFYSKYRFITSTDYLFDSLYFINNTFIQKSINFNDTINDVGELTFDRKFFNYNSDIETQSVVLTSYDFSNLQVNLSTDTTGFTGSFDTTSFTIEISAIHENGRLLGDFVNFNVGDNFNIETNFKSFDTLEQANLSQTSRRMTVPINDLSANDTYTITFSTNRTDIEGLYTSTKSYVIDISAAPYEESRANSIHTVWTTVSSLSNPLDEYQTLSGVMLEDTPEYRGSLRFPSQSLFYQEEFFRPDANLHYSDALDNATNEAIRTKYRYVNDRNTNSANYNTAWYLYPYRDIYDLTGISLRGDNNITLINGKFGLSNTHFGGATNPGSTARFLTTENKIVSATVVGELNLGNDANLIKLSNDITAEAGRPDAGGKVKTYKLPLFDNEVQRPKRFPTLTQAGNYSLGKLRNPEFTGSFSYSDGDEFAALGSTIFPSNGAPLSGSGSVAVGYTSLMGVSSIFENKKLGFPQMKLANGDSSSPSFIVHNNELLLSITFLSTSFLSPSQSFSAQYLDPSHFGFKKLYESQGLGPAYSTKGFHDRIIDGMEALGREGYQLSAVQLD